MNTYKFKIEPSFDFDGDFEISFVFGNLKINTHLSALNKITSKSITFSQDNNQIIIELDEYKSNTFDIIVDNDSGSLDYSVTTPVKVVDKFKDFVKLIKKYQIPN